MIKKIKKNKNGLYDVKFSVNANHLAIESDVNISVVGSFGNWEKIYKLKRKRNSSAYEFTLKNLENGTYEYKYLFSKGNEKKWLEIEDFNTLYNDDICTNSQGTKNGFFVV
jgi:hypothetical protein